MSVNQKKKKTFTLELFVSSVQFRLFHQFIDLINPLKGRCVSVKIKLPLYMEGKKTYLLVTGVL